ncbi:hypothetical protein MTO96_005355 [Rhipicephalus appendiculatus]
MEQLVVEERQAPARCLAVGSLLLAAAAPCLSFAAGLESPEAHVLIPSNLRRGDTAEIFCSLRRGSLPVAFQWLHNGRPIRPSRVGAAEPTGTGQGSNSAEALWKVLDDQLLCCNSVNRNTLVLLPDPSETVLGKKDDHIRVLANGSLVITGVRSSDSGLYRCDVENGVGTLITKTINLTYPEMNSLLPSHRRYDVIDRSFPGGIASDLLIHKSALADTGEFACHVTNRFGTATAIRSLFVLELPSPPIGVKVDDIGKRSARVSWKKPFAEVTHFPPPLLEGKRSRSSVPATVNESISRLAALTGRGRKLSSATVAGTETSAYLQDLQPGTEYSGHIVSQNDVGLSGTLGGHALRHQRGRCVHTTAQPILFLVVLRTVPTPITLATGCGSCQN